MIIYYISLFKNSMWPNGKLAESPPPKTDNQKLQTRLEAKEKFLNNMPGRNIAIYIQTLKAIWLCIDNIVAGKKECTYMYKYNENVWLDRESNPGPLQC